MDVIGFDGELSSNYSNQRPLRLWCLYPVQHSQRTRLTSVCGFMADLLAPRTYRSRPHLTMNAWLEVTALYRFAVKFGASKLVCVYA